MTTQVDVYKKITEFVSDLTATFGNRQHSLQLYNRYLETKVHGEEEKNIHTSIFTKFINENEEAITSRDSSKLKETNIVFNKKCTVKLGEIFKIADNEAQTAIWNHLLIIKTALNPTDDAIKNIQQMFDTKTTEGQFINNMFEKISGSISPNQDPQSALMGIFSSGLVPQLIGDMTSKMENGEINMNSLMSTFQGLMGQMGPMMGGMDLGSMMGQATQQVEKLKIEEVNEKENK